MGVGGRIEYASGHCRELSGFRVEGLGGILLGPN